MAQKLDTREFFKTMLATAVAPNRDRTVAWTVPFLAGVRFVHRPKNKFIKLVINQPEGVNWTKQAGPFARALRNGEYEIKLEMIEDTVIQLMDRVAIFEPDGLENQMDLISIQRRDENGDVRNQNYIEAEKMAKYLTFMMNVKLRNKFMDRMRTLKNPQFFYYASGWFMDETGKVDALDILNPRIVYPYTLTNGMSTDHLAKGFLPISMDIGNHADTAVYMQGKRQVEDGMLKHMDVFAIGGIKKGLARQKLSYCVNGADMGVFKCFILSEVPEELKPMFVAGGMYTPAHIFERVGASRVTNRYLVKSTLSLMEPHIEKDFPDTLVLSKSSFKGELQGIALALMNGKGKPEEVLDPETKDLTDEALKMLNDSVQVREFNGVQVRGFEVTMPLTVTNLIVGYGLSVSDSVKSNKDVLDGYSKLEKFAEFCTYLKRAYKFSDDVLVSDEDDNLQVISSVYLYLLNRMNRDDRFNPVQFIVDGLAVGLFTKSRTTVDVKGFDIMNVYRSYGEKVATTFTDAVVASSNKRGKKNELNAYLIGKLVLDPIDAEVVKSISTTLFKGAASTSKLDAEDLVKRLGARRSEDQYQKWINGFVDGTDKFDGLMGFKPKSITIKDKVFYIPSKAVMQNFMFPDTDQENQPTGRWFMSGPAYLAAELFSMIGGYDGDLTKIPEEHLKMFYVWYNAKMQELTYGYYGENVRVDGFANKMIVANYWDNNTIYCNDPNYTYWDKRVVLFSKVPVLFNKAVHGVNYRTDYDGRFGRLNANLQFALNSCIYVPVDILLAHQNDTDGDMGRVMFLKKHGVPVFTGAELPHYMQGWQQTYVEGEKDLTFKFKSYEKGTVEDLDEAMREAVLAKRTIGRATNLANIVNLIGIQELGEEFTRAGDGLYMMVQEVIRGVKYDTDGESMLDYLSSVSFREIFCAVKHDEDTGTYEDDSYNAVMKLAAKISAQVGDDSEIASQLLYIKEWYTPGKVKALYLKGDSLGTKTEAWAYLTMYVQAIGGLPASKLKRPNYEYFKKYEGKDKEIYTPVLESFNGWCNHLLFCNKFEESAEGLTGLLYRLLEC